MEKKHILIPLLCLLLAAIISPSAATAQSILTPEETTFLKSLNGKWNSGDWGDILFKYLNGKVKVSYPAFFENGVGHYNVVTEYYNSSDKCLEFEYDCEVVSEADKTFRFHITTVH